MLLHRKMEDQWREHTRPLSLANGAPAMSSILVTELQYLAIANAAAALCPNDRDQFVAAIHAELSGPPIGDGTIGRAIRAVQASFHHPEPERVPSRWDRDTPRFEKASKRT